MVDTAKPSGAAPVRDEPEETRRLGDALNRLALIALVAYLAIVVVLIVVAGYWPTIDLVALGILGLALVFGRGRLFFRDWVPFILIFLAWEAMRGLADNFGAAVHSDDVIAVERFISFGIVPSVELQGLFHHVGSVNALDVITSIVYSAHFVFPLAVAFVFWLNNRQLYYRFVGTLLLMALAAFVVYLLFPVAPPRFAYLHGEALAVRDVMGDTIVSANMHPGADWIYQNLSPNDNAAFPSLHAAFPLLAWLFLRRPYPRMGWLVLAWTAVVWFSIVYLGQHYVVDIVGGAAFAIGAYLISTRLGLMDRWLGRLSRDPAAPEGSTGSAG